MTVKFTLLHRYILRFDDNKFTCTSDFTLTTSRSLILDIALHFVISEGLFVMKMSRMLFLVVGKFYCLGKSMVLHKLRNLSQSDNGYVLSTVVRLSQSIVSKSPPIHIQYRSSATSHSH